MVELILLYGRKYFFRNYKVVVMSLDFEVRFILGFVFWFCVFRLVI